MRPTDLDRMAVPGRPTMRGELLLTAVARPDTDTDVYRSSLVRIGPDGPAPWTHGERDTAPAISPDGRWVAFLRATGTDAPQLHVMPAAGGESRRLTDLPLGAGTPVWAPDSRRIAFTARVPEPGRYCTAADGKDAPKPEAEAPRRITRFDYRLDGEGFLRDRPYRLFVVDTETGDTLGADDLSPLTDATVSVGDLAWTPDSTGVVVVAPRDWDAEESLHDDLYLVRVDGGDGPELLVRSAGSVSSPVVTSDGAVYFYSTAFDGFDPVARNTGLWVTSLSDRTAPRRLTDAETVGCEASAGPPAVRDDDVLVAVRHRGAVELRSVAKDATEAALDDLPLLAGERAAVRSFTVDGDRIALVQAGPEDTGEIVLLEGGSARVLTDFSASLREAGIRPMEEVTATAPDGYPVHGWVVKPEGDGPHPVLLVVHGGPFAQYEWSLFDEAQVYASAGYLVVLPNPRGSAGYGESHARAVVGALGTVDADDVLALLDA
jgi:dipeptidyl aminopeptidase/acylaminoacyl peptidase